MKLQETENGHEIVLEWKDILVNFDKFQDKIIELWWKWMDEQPSTRGTPETKGYISLSLDSPNILNVHYYDEIGEVEGVDILPFSYLINYLDTI